MTGSSSRKRTSNPLPASVPFLLSQLGAHVSVTFGDRLEPFGLEKYHAGILNILASHAGITQQALADLLGMFPSRIVALLDEMAKMKLIERRKSASDRRTYALHLTKTGHETWNKIAKLTVVIQDDLCAALAKDERELLVSLLSRIMTQQKITPGVHPGYRRMGGGCGEEEEKLGRARKKTI
jgi:DNA-binding MarR family transcriptional regulator